MSCFDCLSSGIGLLGGSLSVGLCLLVYSVFDGSNIAVAVVVVAVDDIAVGSGEMSMCFADLSLQLLMLMALMIVALLVTGDVVVVVVSWRVFELGTLGFGLF